MKHILILFVCALSACGSSDESSDINELADDGLPSPVSENISSGGGPNNPTEIYINTEYSFSDNSLQNYFRYSGTTGEKIVIHTELDQPLTDKDKARCSGSGGGGGSTPSSYDTHIHIYDSLINRIDGVCGEDLIFKIPTDGVYLINPDYQSTNYGSLFVSSIIGDSSISSPVGDLGQPSNPKPINTNSDNILSSNTFNNYFTINATAGQKLIISAILDTPLSDKQNSRCASNAGRGENASSYDTQIHVYDDKLDRIDGICGEYLEITIPDSGSYILHFSFAKQSAGYFSAAIVN